MDQQDKSGPSYTKGPWFTDRDGNVWRRPPSDLCQNGGGVAGDKPIATVHKGWHGEREIGYPVEANARLIAAAPDLYEALSNRFDNAEQRAFEDWLARTTPSGDVEQVQAQWERSSAFLDFCDEWRAERAALAKATGSQQ